MNWAIPWAPAGDTAAGLKFDSAISCAAISAADTFQRAADRRIGARNRAGTNDGRPPPPPLSPSPPGVEPIEFAAFEHGAGPRSKPKCHASHLRKPKPQVIPRHEGGIALPPLQVPIAAGGSA